MPTTYACLRRAKFVKVPVSVWTERCSGAAGGQKRSFCLRRKMITANKFNKIWAEKSLGPRDRLRNIMSIDVLCNGNAPAPSLMLTPRLPACLVHPRGGEGGGGAGQQDNPGGVDVSRIGDRNRHAAGTTTRRRIPLGIGRADGSIGAEAQIGRRNFRPFVYRRQQCLSRSHVWRVM